MHGARGGPRRGDEGGDGLAGAGRQAHESRRARRCRRHLSRRRTDGEFLQAGGGSDVCFRGRGLGQQGPGAGADGHGRGWPRRCEGNRCGRWPCIRSGRGDQRCLGHARSGHQCRTLLGGAAAAGDCDKTHASVCRGAAMTPDDFDYLRQFLRERSGLVLAAEKQYLAESRLLPVARRNAMSTLAELIERIRNKASAPLCAQVVEAMTTNETFFFRDKIPFDHFRDTIMPTLLAARAREKRVRIWCTAASTGQEPYSLAMAIKTMGSAIAGYRIDILATDLSSEVLEKAKTGIYSQFEVQRGLPVQLLVKFFDQIGDTWQLAPELRSMVQFRPLNLLNDFSVLGYFDVVFCRNVLIYFDQENKVTVLNRISRQMSEDGYLVLGAAETVIGLTEAFKPLSDKRGLYVVNAGAQSRPVDNVIRFAAAKA